MEAQAVKQYRAVTQRRQSRVPPEGDSFQLIDYLLQTHPEDMEWEVARCRPSLGDSFFAALEREIGTCKVRDAHAQTGPVCCREWVVRSTLPMRTRPNPVCLGQEPLTAVQHASPALPASTRSDRQ